jgi:hypothetical protein
MQTVLPRRVVETGGENGGDSGPVSIVGGDTWSVRVESVSESFEHTLLGVGHESYSPVHFRTPQ